MDKDRAIFHLELLLLSVSALVRASTITVDKNHCGGETVLTQGRSLFLNYYGAKLEDDTASYPPFSKTCEFKVSTARGDNEICIRKKHQRRNTFTELGKCSSFFKYYWINSVNTYNCFHFNARPHCTTYNSVTAIFDDDNIFISSRNVSLEFEIYLRPVKQDTQQDTWSSWTPDSNTDTTSDSEYGFPWGLFIFGCLLCFTFFFIMWIYWELKCRPSSEQETERPVGQPDNLFRNEEANRHQRTGVDTLPSERPHEDPWKPPDYQSLTAIDQSFYGETKPCQKLAKETGPGGIEEPPPPYPGV